MRYSIKTSRSSYTENNKKYTTVTKKKTMYVKVGDIIGVVKSASGAVTTLKNSKAKLKDYAKYGTSLVSNQIDALVSLVKASDAYQKVMSTVEKANTAAKLAARLSGMMFSPGNSGDAAQLVVGLVNKALISLATSAMISLKNFIFNYEFEIPLAEESVTSFIVIAIEEASSTYTDSIEDSTSDIEETSSLEDEDDTVESIFGDDETVSDGSSSTESTESEDDTLSSTDSDTSTSDFSKVKSVDGTYIALSNKDKGIFYSTDSMETWNKSDIYYYNETSAKHTRSWKEITYLTLDGTTYIFVGGYKLKSSESRGVLYSTDGGVNFVEISAFEGKNIEQFYLHYEDDAFKSLVIVTSEGLSYLLADTITALESSADVASAVTSSSTVPGVECVLSSNITYDSWVIAEELDSSVISEIESDTGTTLTDDEITALKELVESSTATATEVDLSGVEL